MSFLSPQANVQYYSHTVCVSHSYLDTTTLIVNVKFILTKGFLLFCVSSTFSKRVNNTVFGETIAPIIAQLFTSSNALFSFSISV